VRRFERTFFDDFVLAAAIALMAGLSAIYGEVWRDVLEREFVALMREQPDPVPIATPPPPAPEATTPLVEDWLTGAEIGPLPDAVSVRALQLLIDRQMANRPSTDHLIRRADGGILGTTYSLFWPAASNAAAAELCRGLPDTGFACGPAVAPMSTLTDFAGKPVLHGWPVKPEVDPKQTVPKDGDGHGIESRACPARTRVETLCTNEDRARAQPPLKLQPGLRGTLADFSGGERIWLSGARGPRDPLLVRIAAAGDVMMGDAASGDLNPALRRGADVAHVIGRDLADIFRRADVAFVNLEGVLYDGGQPRAKDCANCFSFRSPEYYSGILASLGIDVVSLANNHSGDYGEAGRDATVAALARAGIAGAGLARADARTATLVLPDGRKVGVAAFATNAGTTKLTDLSHAEAIVAALARTHDIVVVSFHGGAEGWAETRVPRGAEYYLGEFRGDVTRFAHRMVEAGADMVVGHGPHVPRAVEIYRGRLIAYSLGNFWTYTGVINYAVSGLGPVIEAWLEPDGRLAGLTIHSTRQAGLGVPRLDPLDEAARFVRYLTKKDFPATHSLLAGGRRTPVALEEGESATSFAGPGS